MLHLEHQILPIELFQFYLYLATVHSLSDVLSVQLQEHPLLILFVKHRLPKYKLKAWLPHLTYYGALSMSTQLPSAGIAHKQTPIFDPKGVHLREICINVCFNTSQITNSSNCNLLASRVDVKLGATYTSGSKPNSSLQKSLLQQQK